MAINPQPIDSYGGITSALMQGLQIREQRARQQAQLDAENADRALRVRALAPAEAEAKRRQDIQDQWDQFRTAQKATLTSPPSSTGAGFSQPVDAGATAAAISPGAVGSAVTPFSPSAGMAIPPSPAPAFSRADTIRDSVDQGLIRPQSVPGSSPPASVLAAGRMDALKETLGKYSALYRQQVADRSQAIKDQFASVWDITDPEVGAKALMELRKEQYQTPATVFKEMSGIRKEDLDRLSAEERIRSAEAGANRRLAFSEKTAASREEAAKLRNDRLVDSQDRRTSILEKQLSSREEENALDRTLKRENLKAKSDSETEGRNLKKNLLLLKMANDTALREGKLTAEQNAANQKELSEAAKGDFSAASGVLRDAVKNKYLTPEQAQAGLENRPIPPAGVWQRMFGLQPILQIRTNRSMPKERRE